MGMQRAIQLGFATSGLGDAIITPFVYETNFLLSPNPTLMGRFFALFYHPIERSVRVYNDLKVTDYEVQAMTLDQYASSAKAEDNIVTRTLSNHPYGELTEDHVKVALEVIRRKFLVGLGKHLNASLIRFEQFFRWTYHVNPEYQEMCRDRIIAEHTEVEIPAEGTPAWELLAFKNQYDLQLYGYIESLFPEQEQFVADVPEEIRRADATCCECSPPSLPLEGYECPLAIQ